MILLNTPLYSNKPSNARSLLHVFEGAFNNLKPPSNLRWVERLMETAKPPMAPAEPPLAGGRRTRPWGRGTPVASTKPPMTSTFQPSSQKSSVEVPPPRCATQREKPDAGAFSEGHRRRHRPAFLGALRVGESAWPA